MIGLLKILIVEDVPEDVELIKLQCSDIEYQMEFANCCTKAEYKSLLRSFKPDIILSDFNMPNFDGMEALAIYRQKVRLEPFIFVTGSLGEENAVASIKAGATDFITKDKIDQLPVAIIKALREVAVKRQNLAYEGQIKALNTFNAALAKDKEWAEALQDSLEVICRTLDIDRGFYFAVSDDENPVANLKINWGGSKKIQTGGKLDFYRLPLNSIPQILKPLSKGKPGSFLVSDVSDDATREMLAHEGMLSVLFMPLFSGSELCGLLGLADCFKEREWVDDEVHFLKTLAWDLNSAFEKQRANKALKHNEERFRSLVQNGSELITILSKDFYISYTSINYAKILKYNPAKLIGSEFKSLVHPEDWLDVQRALQAMEKRNHAEVESFRLKTAAGDYLWMHAKFSNMQMVPAVHGIVLNMVDIGALKRKEQELTVSRQRFKYAALASEDLVFDWDLKTNKVYRVRSSHELLPQSLEDKESDIDAWLSMMHPKDKDEIYQTLQDQLIQPDLNFINLRYRVIDHHGHVQFIHDKGFIIRDSNSKAQRVVGATSIVTNEKKAELKTQLISIVHSTMASDEGLNCCLHNMIVAIVQETNTNGGEVWLSDTDEEVVNLEAEFNTGTKLTAEEKTGRFARSVGLPGLVMQEKNSLLLSDLNESEVFIRKQIANKNNLNSVVAVPIRYEAEILGVILLFSEFKGNELAFYQELLDEVSTQIGAEIKRKMSESMLETLFEASPDILLIYDVKGKIRKVNPAAITLTGYSQKELLNANIIDLTPQEELDRVKSRMENLLKKEQSGADIGIFETAFLPKNRSKIWLAWSSALVKEEGMIYAIGRDISDRKKHLAEIEAQNERLREIAQIQSHEVRAPLARIMGLLNLFEYQFENASEEDSELINLLRVSADELDSIIKKITNKTNEL